jgi:serine/threonine-protein kinase RsbW
MSHLHRITRAAELDTLPVFRDFIATTCRRAGCDDDVIFDLQLAVDEACTNVIQHGYAGMDPGAIILELKLEPEQVVARLTDFGRVFEPSVAPKPDVHAALEDRPMGGFGLYFIYSVMSAVDYETNENGNCLILTRRVTPAPPTGA